MGYSSSFFYGDYKGWDSSITENQPDASGNYRNYEGTFFNPTRRRSNNTWQYILDNPDRHAFYFLEQKLLQWLQAIGTDAARIYFSQADWDGTKGTSYPMGTVWELLGQDYLAGKKVLDNVNGHRNIFMSRFHYYYNSYYAARGADMSKFSNPWDGNQIITPTATDQGNSNVNNCREARQIAWCNNSQTTAMATYGVRYDWAVVMDDTPGNEFFYILFRRGNYQGALGIGPASKFEDGSAASASGANVRGYYARYGSQPSNRKWGVFTGWGRIQDIDNTLPELTGTDPGWYYVSKGDYLEGVSFGSAEYGGACLGISPNLELVSVKNLVHDHQVGSWNLKADSTGVRPDMDYYVPENTDRPVETPPFGSPAWMKRLGPRLTDHICDSSVPLAMKNMDSDSNNPIPNKPWPDGRPNTNSRIRTRQYGVKAPIYTHFGNVMGHMGTNILINRGDYSTYSADIYNYMNSPATFEYDGSVWENFDGMAFRTGIAAP